MKIFFAVFVLSLSLVLAGCGPQSVHQIKQELDLVTGSAYAAIKINHSDYTSGVYGPVGSDEAVAARVKAATVLNEVLIPISVAVEVGNGMTAANFTGSKAQIIQLLQTAALTASQRSTGNPKIDLALQTIAAFINTALTVIQALTSADIRTSPGSILNQQAVALENIIEANRQEVCPCV